MAERSDFILIAFTALASLERGAAPARANVTTNVTTNARGDRVVERTDGSNVLYTCEADGGREFRDTEYFMSNGDVIDVIEVLFDGSRRNVDIVDG